MYSSATEAANATNLRYYSRTMPSVSVPVWFDHWGTYQGKYANWGHVVVWVPGRGFLSSPGVGFGQLWLSSLEEVEKTFNAKYRFWSLDINTLQVAKAPPIKEEDPMPLQTSTHSHNPKQVIPPNKWSYLRLNDKNWITFFQGGDKVKSGVAHLSIGCSGEADVRFVLDEVNADGSSVVKSLPSVRSRISSSGIHSWPVHLNKGSKNRYRVQVMPVGSDSITVTSVRTITNYWEK